MIWFFVDELGFVQGTHHRHNNTIRINNKDMPNLREEVRITRHQGGNNNRISEATTTKPMVPTPPRVVSISVELPRSCGQLCCGVELAGCCTNVVLPTEQVLFLGLPWAVGEAAVVVVGTEVVGMVVADRDFPNLAVPTAPTSLTVAVASAVGIQRHHQPHPGLDFGVEQVRTSPLPRTCAVTQTESV
jgi:hypothetical protein